MTRAAAKMLGRFDPGERDEDAQFPLPGACRWGESEEQLEKFLRAVDGPMLHWLWRKFRSVLDAAALEDVHQDCLERVIRSWRRDPDPGRPPRGPGTYLPWLCTVWANRARQRIRQKKDLPEGDHATSGQLQERADQTIPSREEMMHDALRALRPEELQIVECELKQIPSQQAAAMLDMSAAAYYKTKQRLFHKLRALLKREE